MQKASIILFLLCLSFMPVNNFLEWRGRDFPQKSELNYSTGTLEYSRAPGKNSTSFIILRSIDGSGQDTAFGCSYTAFTSSTTGSCMGLRSVEPYLAKRAKVGWYYQSEFLGFKNNRPQLVSLEVDGKYIKTYEETKRIYKITNKSGLFICLFFMALSIFIFIFFLYPKDNIHK